MNLKLKKMSTKSFITIFSTINVIAGFILGTFVTIGSLLTPNEQGSALGVWSILFFPIINGFLGLVGGLFLTGLYNLLAPRLGGIELEFETVE
jgi:hypothetical protein